MSTKIISKVLSCEEKIADKTEKRKKRLQVALSSLQKKLAEEEQQAIAKAESAAKKRLQVALNAAETEIRDAKKEFEKRTVALKGAFEEKKSQIAKKAIDVILQ